MSLSVDNFKALLYNLKSYEMMFIKQRKKIVYSFFGDLKLIVKIKL